MLVGDVPCKYTRMGAGGGVYQGDIPSHDII
jgi:hypothetical protein